MLCDACGAPATKKCARCRAVVYCGRACQRRGWWAGHASTCVGGYLMTLPREMMVAIFLYLDGRALASAAQTCSAFRDLVLDVRRWWGVPIAATPTRILHVDFYKSLYGGIYRVGSLFALFVLPVGWTPSAFVIVDIERGNIIARVDSPIQEPIDCIVEFEGLVAVCALRTIYLFDSEWKLVREWIASDRHVGNMCVFEHSLAAPAGSDVILWNASGARSRVLVGHHGGVECVTVFGYLLATAAKDDVTIIALWDACGTCVRTFIGGYWIHDLGAFGDLLVTKDTNGRVALWTANGTRVAQMETATVSGQTSSLVASSRTLAVESDHGVSFWTAEGVKIQFIRHVQILARHNIAFAGEHFVHNREGKIAIW